MQESRLRRSDGVPSFLLAVVLAVALVGLGTSSASRVMADPLAFLVDTTLPTTEWKHYWSECAGSGHALLALRQDYRDQLAMARRDLGLKSVVHTSTVPGTERFHGIFDDDLSTVLNVDPSGTVTYSFFNLDSIYDFLLSIGMKPYVELSFMPEDLASNHTYVFHYRGNTSPPKDYQQWANLITAFVKHLIERYGIDEIRTWLFEVWNEPNLGFWSGTQDDYFKLYSYTSRAIKAVDSKIRVGGPATAQSQWIAPFKSFVTSSGLPLDFISTHEYPTDIQPQQRDILKKVFTETRQEASPYPVIYSEYNSGLYNPPNLLDDSYASAFVMYNVQSVQGIVELMSYWTFSDIFEEQGFDSTPFHQGFGMMTIHQVPKPVYRAFEILHRTGEERLNVSGPDHSTVGTFAISNKGRREIIIISYNFNIPGHPIQTETVFLSVRGLALTGQGTAVMERIDDTHCNPASLWRKMGSPQYLNQHQIDQLVQASVLDPTKIAYHSTNSDAVAFDSFSVPPQGVVAITLRY